MPRLLIFFQRGERGGHLILTSKTKKRGGRDVIALCQGSVTSSTYKRGRRHLSLLTLSISKKKKKKGEIIIRGQRRGWRILIVNSREGEKGEALLLLGREERKDLIGGRLYFLLASETGEGRGWFWGGGGGGVWGGGGGPGKICAGGGRGCF